MGEASERTIGILGGMGPEATVELFRRILSFTPAVRDQDHIHVFVDSDPKIPDRTAAIIGQGESPLPALVAAARNLERAGADFIAIPCNTAHYWLSELRAAVSIPIIDMIAETAKHIAASTPPLHAIGLLATVGTLSSGLYQRAFAELGISLLTPNDEQEVDVTKGIERIKAGEHDVRDSLIDVSEKLIDRGAEGIIPGCTELSLVITRGTLSVPVFDPLSILAERAVALAREG